MKDIFIDSCTISISSSRLKPKKYLKVKVGNLERINKTIKFINNTNEDVFISFDGIEDRFLVIQDGLLKLDIPDLWCMPEAQIIFIKGKPGTGNICIYYY